MSVRVRASRGGRQCVGQDRVFGPSGTDDQGVSRHYHSNYRILSFSPIQAYADQLAGVFTPIILLLASLTFCVWLGLCYSGVVPSDWYANEERGDPVLFSLLFAISVVVISCPCALGLATPTAIMVGTGVGASNGILIKGGPAFEVAHRVQTVVFDKTGTLTEGKPRVTDVVVLDPSVSSDEVFLVFLYS